MQIKQEEEVLLNILQIDKGQPLEIELQATEVVEMRLNLKYKLGS